MCVTHPKEEKLPPLSPVEEALKTLPLSLVMTKSSISFFAGAFSFSSSRNLQSLRRKSSPWELKTVPPEILVKDGTEEEMGACKHVTTSHNTFVHQNRESHYDWVCHFYKEPARYTSVT